MKKAPEHKTKGDFSRDTLTGLMSDLFNKQYGSRHWSIKMSTTGVLLVYSD